MRAPCRRLVEAVRDGELRATTTPEVIQEFAHVRGRRRSRHDAADLAADFARLLAPLIVIDDEDLHAGLLQFRDHKRLGAFDAVLVAAGLRHEATAFVSADRAFATVDELPHVDPAADDLPTRLGLA